MSDYKMTKHAEKRCQQRGIPPECIQLIAEYGTPTRHGYYLTRKDIQAFERKVKNQIEKMYKAENVLVPVEDGRALSVYPVREPKKRRRCRHDAKGVSQ